MKLRTGALALVLLASALGLVAPRARAQGKPQPSPSLTPEQKKEQQKEKDYNKAKDDLEKQLKAKKVDPAPWVALLNFYAYSMNLEVKDSVDLVHKVMAKKGLDPNEAQTAAFEKQRLATDPKTNKVDLKKFLLEYKKWISEWKPPKAPPAGSGNR